MSRRVESVCWRPFLVRDSIPVLLACLAAVSGCGEASCPEGSREVEGRCVRLGSCAELECDPNATCDDSGGEAVCTCKQGYEGDGLSCTLTASASPSGCDEAGCDPNATCDDSGGEAVCTCGQGYEGDGLSCTALPPSCDELECDPNATCSDRSGIAVCSCRDDFEGDGTTCNPVVPCDQAGCDPDATCDDSSGIAVCSCPDTFVGDGTTCTALPTSCDDAECDPRAACDDSSGVALCTCPRKFEGDGTVCTPVVPCDQAGCDPDAACDDSSGIAVCSCPVGYEGDGESCERNGCIPLGDDPPPCGVHAVCTDLGGGEIACECEPGYESCDGDGDPEPGCETHVDADTDNCGACGYACAGELGCEAGECEPYAVQLSLGDDYSCARILAIKVQELGLKAIQAYCWGSNYYGQLSDGDLDTGSSANNYRSTPDLTEALWGAPVRDLSAGSNHVCALQQDADIVECWGEDNGSKKLGDTLAPSALSVETAIHDGPRQVVAGRNTSCARVQNGEIRCWGYLFDCQPEESCYRTYNLLRPVLDLDPASSFALGGYFLCAIIGSGAVQCLGGDDYNSPLRPVTDVAGNPLTGVVGVSNQFNHGCDVLDDGRLMCWGSNYYGQLGNGSYAEYGPPLDDFLRAVQVTGLDDVVQVATGTNFTCALDSSGQLYCWGDASGGKLGLGDGAGVEYDGRHMVLEPAAVPDMDDIAEVALGNGHGCARRRSGQILCWGSNSMGQLGDGTRTLRTSPVQVESLPWPL